MIGARCVLALTLLSVVTAQEVDERDLKKYARILKEFVEPDAPRPAQRTSLGACIKDLKRDLKDIDSYLRKDYPSIYDYNLKYSRDKKTHQLRKLELIETVQSPWSMDVNDRCRDLELRFAYCEEFLETKYADDCRDALVAEKAKLQGQLAKATAARDAHEAKRTD